MYMQNILLRGVRGFINTMSLMVIKTIRTITIIERGAMGLLLVGFLLNNTALARTDDIKQPVHINADSVTFNKAKGYAIYQGNVSIQQGSLRISAVKIEIFAPNNTIQRIEASGLPVSFQQEMDDGKTAKGQANSIRYLVQKKELRLAGNAKLTQDRDTFSSAYISYAVNTGELKAGSNKSTSKKQTNRVKAIFYPTNK